MKKLMILMAVLAAVMLMAGCQKSSISAEDNEELAINSTEEAETVTMHATEEYTIPEGATGPADVTVEDVQQYYPDNFKTGEIGDVVQVLFYYINSSGLHQEFSVVEGTDCTPEALVQCLVNEGVLGEGTEVTSFETDGGNATVELNWLVGCSESATPELLAQAVANTFIDNLNLDKVTVKEIEGETYGPLEYKYK